MTEMLLMLYLNQSYFSLAIWRFQESFTLKKTTHYEKQLKKKKKKPQQKTQDRP